MLASGFKLIMFKYNFAKTPVAYTKLKLNGSPPTVCVVGVYVWLINNYT